MDCSPPSSSVHGFLQARTLEWSAMPSSSGSFQLRDRPSVSLVSYVFCIGKQVLYHQHHLGNQLLKRGKYRSNPIFPLRSVVKVDKRTSVLVFLWRKYDLNSSIIHKMGFPCSSVGKESACSTGDPGSILGLGRSPGEGNGNWLQYPCLENLMDTGACWAAVHGDAESGMTEWLTLTYYILKGAVWSYDQPR